MFANLSIHGVTSVRMGEPEVRQSDSGKPYAVRKVLFGTTDGSFYIDLFTRLDDEASKVAGDHLAALITRPL